MRATIHLCFDGQCEAAFRRYQQVFGGRIGTLLAYGESPLAAQVPPEWHDRIAHASLQGDNFELTGVDVAPPDYQRPQGFFATLAIAGIDEAKRVFQSLAEGGEIRLPFQPTFWSAGFGVLVDRFHVPWEINCEQAPLPSPVAAVGP